MDRCYYDSLCRVARGVADASWFAKVLGILVDMANLQLICRAIIEGTAEDAVLEALRPGVPVADLYPIAEAVVAQGAPPHFAPDSLTLPGFVGHGIGLEIDEPPVLWPRDENGTCLQAGMVLAIEIEVSAPNQGTMVKLEDTVVMRPDGYELLTSTLRELIECG